MSYTRGFFNLGSRGTGIGFKLIREPQTERLQEIIASAIYKELGIRSSEIDELVQQFCLKSVEYEFPVAIDGKDIASGIVPNFPEATEGDEIVGGIVPLETYSEYENPEKILPFFYMDSRLKEFVDPPPLIIGLDEKYSDISMTGEADKIIENLESFILMRGRRNGNMVYGYAREATLRIGPTLSILLAKEEVYREPC